MAECPTWSFHNRRAGRDFRVDRNHRATPYDAELVIIPGAGHVPTMTKHRRWSTPSTFGHLASRGARPPVRARRAVLRIGH